MTKVKRKEEDGHRTRETHADCDCVSCGTHVQPVAEELCDNNEECEDDGYEDCSDEKREEARHSSKLQGSFVI